MAVQVYFTARPALTECYWRLTKDTRLDMWGPVSNPEHSCLDLTKSKIFPQGYPPSMII